MQREKFRERDQYAPPAQLPAMQWEQCTERERGLNMPRQPSAQPKTKNVQQVPIFLFLKTQHKSHVYPGGVRILQIWLVNSLERIETIETILLVNNNESGNCTWEVCQLESAFKKLFLF